MSSERVLGILLAVLFVMPGIGALAGESVPSITNSIGMEFVPIPPGSFKMGDEQGARDGLPIHRITISKAFHLGKYEVTQAQWETVMGNNPSKFKGANRPVEYVTWNEAQEFIKRLNAREQTTVYRLPTEAEWEYAVRAGTTTPWYWGIDPNLIAQYVWFDENAKGQTQPVGLLKPNGWGLYDMLGNVMEWTQDRYDDSFYDYAEFLPETDPTGPEEGDLRVNRGGNWRVCSASIRPGRRGNDDPNDRGSGIGFRVARTSGSK